MEDLVGCLLIILIIIGSNRKGIKRYSRKRKWRKKQKVKYQVYKIQEAEYIPNNIRYHRVDLLTQNEYRFYERLKQYVYPHGLQILAKIRLADLVNADTDLNRSENASAFAKIKAKHVDFAIAKDMDILIIIELDDSSHQRSDRQERDNFVNEVLLNAGYKVVRTYGDMLPVMKALYDYGYDIERIEKK